ncbi:MAG TPA: hypothetical protein PK808_10430 [Polymorphobacter sp.]|nr:hypothetical protein [Polymorphobacter sp.]
MRSPLPLRVPAFRGEESAWFGKAYVGSSALLGKLDHDDIDAPVDRKPMGERVAVAKIFGGHADPRHRFAPCPDSFGAFREEYRRQLDGLWYDLILGHAVPLPETAAHARNCSQIG